MAPSVTKLTSPLVKSAVLADVEELLGRIFGQRLELQPGSPVAAILDTFVGWAVDDIWNPIVVPALRAPFLDYTSGDWLSIVSDLIYNRPRIGAQAGTQSIKFENRSILGAVSQAAGTVRIKAVAPSPAAGKTYTTTTALAIDVWTGSGPYPTGTATVKADIAGTSSNVAVGGIGVFPVPLVMGPVNCFVQLPAGGIFGIDEEGDDPLKARDRVAVSEASDMGPRAEYTSISLDPVGAFTRRDRTPPPSWGTGLPAISRVAVLEPGGSVVNVRLASSSGAAAGDMGTDGSDVNKAWVALTTFVVPPGTTCFAYAATNKTVNPGAIIITLSAESNASAPEAVANATAGLIAFFKVVPIGGTKLAVGGPGYLFEAAVSQACWGPGVVDISVAGLDDDTPFAIAATEVPVLGAYAISANVVGQGT